MPLLQYHYPKPEVVETLKPVFFKEANAILLDNPLHKGYVSATIEFTVRNNEYEIWSNWQADLLTDKSLQLARLAVAKSRRPHRVGHVMVRFSTGKHGMHEEWHEDGVSKNGIFLIASDQNTTLFAHGKHFGMHYLQSRNQTEKATKIAQQLEIYRANPFEVVAFNRNVLHTAPAEDLRERTSVRVVAK